MSLASYLFLTDNVIVLTVVTRTSLPQSYFGTARRSRSTMQLMSPNSPQNCPSPSTITTPSNAPIPRPTALTIRNDIRIQSAVLPQYTLSGPTDREPAERIDDAERQHRHTQRSIDGLGNRSTPLALTLALLIDSDELKRLHKNICGSV